MIADTQVMTKEFCDYCGPFVGAEFRIGTLTFCGHCTRYGKAKAIAFASVRIENEFDTVEVPNELVTA